MKVIKVEIWKDIPGYECLYQASTDGQIRSVDRIVHQDGRGSFDGHRKGRVLKQRMQNGGYLIVVLSKVGHKKVCTVHRLVAKTFIPQIDTTKDDINHKDGNKANNCVDNLEWCNRSENHIHAYRTLHRRHSQQKDVLCVETGEVFDSAVSAAKDVGISASAIRHAAGGFSKSAGGFHWKWV